LGLCSLRKHICLELCRRLCSLALREGQTRSLPRKGLGKKVKPEGEEALKSKARKVKSSLEAGPSIGMGMGKGKHKEKRCSRREGDAGPEDAGVGLMPAQGFHLSLLSTDYKQAVSLPNHLYPAEHLNAPSCSHGQNFIQ
jgi:hypothetical protein